jgi:hypothetical protein
MLQPAASRFSTSPLIPLPSPLRMKKDAEAAKLPPIYRGKWASASAEEVQAMKDQGVPFCYRWGHRGSELSLQVPCCCRWGHGGRIWGRH